MKVDELAKELTKVLEEELSLQKKLVALAESKRDALINIDVEKVENITREETGIVLALTKVGQRRVRTISAIATATSNKDNVSRVSQIVEGVNEPHKTNLSLLISELKDVMANSRRLNKQNKLLIENSMLHIKCFFDAITSAANNTVIYTKRGVADKASPLSVINAVG